MYENKSNLDPCPVNTYLAYRVHRPAVLLSEESPFYLAENIEVPNKERQQWYKCSSLGVWFTAKHFKENGENSSMETDKRLENHRKRKRLVQELVDNDFPSTEIMQNWPWKRCFDK